MLDAEFACKNAALCRWGRGKPVLDILQERGACAKSRACTVKWDALIQRKEQTILGLRRMRNLLKCIGMCIHTHMHQIKCVCATESSHSFR